MSVRSVIRIDGVNSDDPWVRVEDGLISAVELTMVVTGKNKEDSEKCLNGITKYRTLTVQQAELLVLELPGPMAKDTRVQIAENIVTQMKKYDAEEDRFYWRTMSDYEYSSWIAAKKCCDEQNSRDVSL